MDCIELGHCTFDGVCGLCGQMPVARGTVIGIALSVVLWAIIITIGWMVF